MLLPNSAGVAVVFIALQTIGRVPAMLNFSAGPVNVLAAMKAAQVKTVLTSKAFIEKGKLDKLIAAIAPEARVVYLEDVRATISFADKLAGLRAGTAPRVARKADDPAVVLFTSGSEGTPKGVVLSHRNILANAAQALARVDANANDKVFNVLPVFHSFGLTGGMMMPLLAGIPIFMYPSPLHYRIVPELIYQTGATILFGTDTFLAGYARSAHAYDFRTLRLVLAGAEAVKDRTRQVYMERYGIRILEGYGVTETAPVLAMNTPMANRPGTVGRLSPLMESRLDPVPGIEEGGRLSVRGPNVMLGYLRAENPGVLEPLVDGWHDTGDIVTHRRRGLHRHQGPRQALRQDRRRDGLAVGGRGAWPRALWPQATSVAVTIPDPRKGERIVLLTTQKDAERSAMQRQAKTVGASELAVPADHPCGRHGAVARHRQDRLCRRHRAGEGIGRAVAANRARAANRAGTANGAAGGVDLLNQVVPASSLHLSRLRGSRRAKLALRSARSAGWGKLSPLGQCNSRRHPHPGPHRR